MKKERKILLLLVLVLVALSFNRISSSAATRSKVYLSDFYNYEIKYGTSLDELKYKYKIVNKSKKVVKGTFNLELPKGELLNAGYHTCPYTFVPKSNLYKTLKGEVKIYISQKFAYVNIAEYTKTEGEKDPKIEYTTTGLIGNDEIIGEITRKEGETVGTYKYSKKNLKVSDNYTIRFEYERGFEIVPSIKSEVTSTSITVETSPNCEYSIDNKKWVSDGVFKNLSPNTEYTIYARCSELKSIATTVNKTVTTKSK